LFAAPWCTPCHHLENDIRNRPGAVAALEANFVPVKINFDYYPNTAKQYGVTRLPTTVILAPNAKGEVLAVIPEYMPVDQYLSKLNKVAADAKQRDAGVFAQIQASPPVGAPVISPPSMAGSSPPASPADSAQASAVSRPPLVAVPNSSTAMTPPTVGSPVPGRVADAAPSAGSPPANAMATMTAGPGLFGHPSDPLRPADSIKPRASLLYGLDGFCPVQLLENGRWQPGKKAWGVIHRGRTYLFSGADEQHRFQADPDRYAPVSSGDDVVVLLEQGRSVSGYRQHGLQFDGHIYLFASESTLEKFRSNPHYYADRAMQAIRSTPQSAAIR
jgi:YHS domain-containing protein